jgi:hypothetical protein
MNDTGFLDGLLDIFMAGKTQIFPSGHQKVPDPAGVRVVAVGAGAGSYDLMDTGRGLRKQVIVTRAADPVRFRGEQIPMIGRVGVMALGALPVSDRAVYVAELHLLCKRLVACQAKLSTCTRFKLVWILSLGA